MKLYVGFCALFSFFSLNGGCKSDKFGMNARVAAEHLVHHNSFFFTQIQNFTLIGKNGYMQIGFAVFTFDNEY